MFTRMCPRMHVCMHDVRVFLFVCMYVTCVRMKYVHICMLCVCPYAGIRTHIYIPYMCMYVCTCTYAALCMYTYACTHIPICAHGWRDAYAEMQACVYLPTCKHACMHPCRNDIILLRQILFLARVSKHQRVCGDMGR